MAWVDNITRGVFVSFRAAGGTFGPPVLASPDEGSDAHPVLTMDSGGTTTVAWQATWPGAFPMVVAVQPPPPPGLVMAATGPFGGPFAAPRIAIPNPSGATPGAGGSGQIGSANAGKLAMVGDDADRVLVSGLVGVSQLPWPAPAPLAGLTYATAGGGGAFAAGLPITGLPASSISAPTWTLGPGGQILGAYAGVSGTTSQLQTTLLQADGTLTSEAPYTYAAIGGLTAASLGGGFDAGGDAIVAFTVDHTISTGAFANGNFSGGSILSVVRPAGGTTWCPAQVVSGLMSP